MIQKTTVIVVVSAIAIVTWVGGTLFFRYMTDNFHIVSKDINADVLCNDVEQEKPAVVTVTDVPAEPETVVEESIIEPVEELIEEPEEVEKDEPIIIASLIKKDIEEAGFLKPSMQVTEFTGIFLKRVDVRDYINEQAVDYQIVEPPSDQTRIVELTYPEAKIANEIFKLIKDEFVGEIGLVINETGQYADGSFFVNNTGEKNTVFLVVQMDKYIYTFHYLAKNHTKIKNVINILSNGT